MSSTERRERGDGPLYRRGKVWWGGYYHHGRYLRESLHTTDRGKAGKVLRNKMRLANTPHFVAPDQQLVTSTWPISRTTVAARCATPSASLSSYAARSAWTRRSPSPPTASRPTRLDGFAEGKAKATVNRELSALRRMFSLAVEAGRLVWKPAITMLDESDNVREGFFEPAEFDAVCRQLPTDVADAVTFAYLTGWRRGEVIGLEWSRVTLDDERGVITLPPKKSKNKKPRTLILAGDLLALVQHRWAERVPACPHVFHRDGRRLRDFRRVWQAACDAAGVHGRLFDDLRRSAVPNMVRARVPEKLAMKVSGHETRSVFDRYNIVSEDDIAAAIESTTSYVARERQKRPRVEPLRRPNTHISRTVEPDTKPVRGLA